MSAPQSQTRSDWSRPADRSQPMTGRDSKIRTSFAFTCYIRSETLNPRSFQNPNAGLYLILPVVLVVVQLFFARLSTPNKEPDAVTLAFPFVIGISTLVSPQGLGIYWLTNSVLSLAQTQLARTEADSEFPELKEIWDTYADKPEEVRQGDKVSA
ncbi:unnamed protein product [Prorocentrum cordatum]|uniref:Uncharacterized protein n=1 Tax=Prorocentrum cordatum TaxID=2364126 RepID=A0ABN9V3U2_9DINO|nr:unnamed protein product [Polarella glacialis]